MEHPMSGCNSDYHQNVMKQHLKDIIANETVTLKLQNEEHECRDRFIRCLEVILEYGDTETTYSFATNPVFASFLGSWGYPGMKRMSCFENKFDMYELQNITDWQKTQIEKEKTTVCEMRNCFQIVLGILAKDEKDKDLLAKYHSVVGGNASKHPIPSIDKELKDLRKRVKLLEQKLEECTTKRLKEDAKCPTNNTYNILYPKSVYIHSHKNLVAISGTSSRSPSSVEIISSTNSSCKLSKVDIAEHGYTCMDRLKISDEQSDENSGSGKATTEPLQIQLLKPVTIDEWAESTVACSQQNVQDIHPKAEHHTVCKPLLETGAAVPITKQCTPQRDDRIDEKQNRPAMTSRQMHHVEQRLTTNSGKKIGRYETNEVYV